MFKRNKKQLLIIKKNLIKFKFLLNSYKKCKFKTYNKYRIVNDSLFFFKSNSYIIGKDKDNFKSNFLILIRFENGCYSYYPSTISLKTNIFFFLFKFNYQLGNITILKYLYPQTWFHNLESNISKKSSYIKAGGCYGILLLNNKKLSYIKLPSKKIICINNNLKLIVGRADNLLHKYEFFGKAGYKKYFGLKPKVRGTAKNAIDHPHGGRTNIGRPQHNPWGRIIK